MGCKMSDFIRIEDIDKYAVHSKPGPQVEKCLKCEAMRIELEREKQTALETSDRLVDAVYWRDQYRSELMQIRNREAEDSP